MAARRVARAHGRAPAAWRSWAPASPACPAPGNWRARAMPISSWSRGRNTPATPAARWTAWTIRRARTTCPCPRANRPTCARCWPTSADRARRRRRHALLRRNRAGPFAAGTTAARWPLGRQPAADAGPARGRPGAAPPLPGPGRPLHTRRGNDGRKVFAIPLTLSSRDPAWTALDGITFRQWLEREGYTSPALRWYLDYCCRDDCGAVGRGPDCTTSRATPCRQRRRGRGADLAGRPVDTGGAHARGDQRQAGPCAALPARPRASAKRPPARASHASPMTAAPTPWARAVCAMPLFVAQRLLPDIRAYGYDPAVHRRARPGWCRTSSWTAIRWKRPANRCPGTTWSTRARTGLCGLHAPAAAGGAVAAQRVHRLPCSESPGTRRRAPLAQPGQPRGLARSRRRPDRRLWRGILRARRLDITVRGHAMATRIAAACPTPDWPRCGTSTARSCSPTPTCRAIRCSRKRPGGA